MLNPSDRRLLLDVLTPPDGYELDHAIGTTYTLDLLALLRVPLAATTLPWTGSTGEPTTNPFALLAALRRNASKISLYCHAGATKVPHRHVPLLTFLEDAVHPVTPPKPGGVFHPKVWVLRFKPVNDDEDPVRYRLVVLSRNLTFDRSWDTALSLDGELSKSTRQLTERNKPLTDFLTALPRMAKRAGTTLPAAAHHRASLITSEVPRVAWELPDGFHDHWFHSIGHNTKSIWPFEDLRDLLVASPFVGPGALARLRDSASGEMSLISRFDDLTLLAPETVNELALTTIHAFDDPAFVLEADSEEPDSEEESAGPGLSGLHAKLFLGSRGRRAVVYVGSANATDGAFDNNVEFLVELEGSNAQHGIDPFRDGLTEFLRPFTPGTPGKKDEDAEQLTRTLERVAHALASGGLRASVTELPDDRWQMSLHANDGATLNGLRLKARPLSDIRWKTVDLDRSPACQFPPTSRSSITAFVALRLTGRTSAGEQDLDVTVRLPLEGAPSGRAEAVTAELLSDRELLLRFIQVLLSDGLNGALDKLVEPKEHGTTGTAGSASQNPLGLPLLEPILRALQQSPEQLDEVDQLLRDVRTAGPAAADLLPPDLEAIWSTVTAVRESFQ